MDLSVYVIGLNFKLANLDRLGHVQWPDPKHINTFLKCVKSAFGVDECFFLQSCNRREFYFYAPNLNVPADEFKTRFLEFLGKSLNRELNPDEFLYYEEAEAAQHLFRVASSLESMVLGETEIIKQIKDQFKMSARKNNSGKYLRSLVETALRTSKKVRTQTQITKNIISMSSLIYRGAMSFMKDMKKKRLVFVGAGHFITSMLPTFSKSHDVEILFVNRTLPTWLAEEYGGKAMSLEEFKANPPEFDVLVSATGASHAIFSTQWVAGLANRPILLVDGAVPSDFEEGVADLDKVYYKDLNEMEITLAENRDRRAEEIPKAQPLFDEATKELRERWHDFELSEINSQISLHYRVIGQKHLDYLFKDSLSDMSEEEKEMLAQWTNGLVSRLVNVPILGLKGVAREYGNDGVAAFVRNVDEGSNLFSGV